MPFIQVKETNFRYFIVCTIFALFMMSGCATTDTPAPNDQTESQTPAADTETAASAAASASDQRMIHAVEISKTDMGLEVLIQGNQKLVYTSIKQDFPFGIAVYLPETKIGQGLTPPSSPDPAISAVDVSYADKEQTTVKIEIQLTQDLNYEVLEEPNALQVSLSGSPQGPVVVQKATPVPSEQPVQAASSMDAGKSAPATTTPAATSKTATMTNIEFNVLEDGRSDIVVQTNHPVRYDVIQGKDGKLYLNLYNTVIPYYHKRALLTHYFESAVESLMPLQIPGPAKDAKIEISTRDNVPYRIVQDNNVISLFFEPSTIKPPKFEKSKKIVSSGEQVETVKSPSQTSPATGPKQTADAQAPPAAETATAKKAAARTVESEMFGSGKQYTGEKIKLDFYETDIKNVIRILRSVGGMNFAIDKNVTGKVTLSLEEPVPWDQVLDLVLRMNNLGQKKEGNVIRIATLDTIKKEEKLIQDAIAARKKSIQDQKSLEPLVTEYIPINYSDAESDIKPHIEQILSKDRGKVSIDKRTNTVIVTDIQSKVDQAKEIIYRLDKVTPQIMIEAKIVEVTKNFSRELGMGIGFTKSQTEYTGRDRDFSIALNHPVTAALNTGSFNFYRILGSNFLSLNAQIAASETKGDLKIVSAPRILTLDNKAAKIKQGLEVGYTVTDGDGNVTTSFKSVDLLLEVTPHVTPDRRISMTVKVTKNDVDSYISGVPTISTNEAATELLVNDRDTIIIGGIVKTTESDSDEGTPYLSGIPIIGRLFRIDLNTNTRNELLIFITPSIIQLEQKRNLFTSPN